MEPLAQKERIALAAIVLAAFVLRVAYVLGQRGDVLFDYPVVDEERYVAMARMLASGGGVEPRAWLHPPGLVYALAAVFRVAGPGLLAPRIVQAAISAGCCALAFYVARRLFDRRIAFATAAICALHGVLVFESYELLPPTWVMATNLVALGALLVAAERRTPASALGAGAAIGVSAVFAPVVLPFVPIAAAYLWRAVAGGRALVVAALVAGVAVPIAPVTLGNWQRGHELVLVSTNGGVNFAIGNSERYDELLALRPGEHWVALMDEPRQAGVALPGAGSAYFVRKGLAFWRAHPVDAAALYLRKLWLYFNGAELPRDTDIYAARESSPLLAALVSRGPPWLPDGALVPLAILGAAACVRERRARIVVAFVAAQAIVIAAFFVTSRYRVNALPMLAMLAAFGGARLARAWPDRAARATNVAALVALVVAANLPSREARASYAAELDFYRGLAHLRYRHDFATAVERFRASTARDPNDARAWFELGNALDGARRTDEAIDAWRRAGDLDPWDGRARRRAANALAARGDLAGAVACLEAHVAARRHEPRYYAVDHLTLAMLHARSGDYARATDELAAATADPRWVRGQLASWARAALDAQGLDDPAFWRAVAGALDDAGQPDLAGQARARSVYTADVRTKGAGAP